MKSKSILLRLKYGTEICFGILDRSSVRLRCCSCGMATTLLCLKNDKAFNMISIREEIQSYKLSDFIKASAKGA